VERQPRQDEKREEHEGDHERGQDNRSPRLRRGAEDHIDRASALAFRLAVLLAQAPEDVGPVAQRQRDVADGHVDEAPEPADQVLLPAVHVDSRRRSRARLVESGHDFLDGEPGLDEGGRVQLDDELADPAAEGHDLGDAGERDKK
jgi:hypothetical protein